MPVVYFTCLDLETTGLRVSSDRIVQIAVTTHAATPTAFSSRSTGRTLDVGADLVRICGFSAFALPGMPISAGAARVTGITDAVLAARSDAVALPKALRLLKVYFLRIRARMQSKDRHVLVTHNGSMFDVPVLLSNYRVFNMKPALPGVTDVLDMYTYYTNAVDRRDPLTGSWRSFKLADVYAREVPAARREHLASRGTPHDATFDILMLFEVLLAVCRTAPAVLLSCVSPADRLVQYWLRKLDAPSRQ